MGAKNWKNVKIYRVWHGLAAGILLGLLFAVIAFPVVEWSYGTLFEPRPKYAHLSVIEYATQVNATWLFVPFAVLYLVPLLLVDYIAGLGRDGLVGIAAYCLVWALTAAYLQLPPLFLQGLVVAIPIILAFKFTTWVVGGRYGNGSQDIQNDLWDW